MRGWGAQRVLYLAVAVLFAGLLTIPLKALPGSSTRVLAGPGPAALGRAESPPPPAEQALPAPVAEHPIQNADEPGGGDVSPVWGPSAEEPSTPPPAPRQAAEQQPPTPESQKVFGLVVGVNDYPGRANDLQGAVNDADDMTDALAESGVPPENVHELLDDDATAQGVIDGLHWLVSATAPDSTVVLFYAGHVRKLSQDTEAIVTSEGAVLPDWYLAQQLGGLSAHDVWIVMATCYGGGFTELLAPGRILTAAADADSLAYENETLGRSYLDEYLVHRALLEHGISLPVVQDAVAYAQAGLQRDYPNRQLTEIDESSEPISLDGVHRDQPASPPTTTSPSPPPSAGGPSGTPPSGTPTPPPAPTSPPPAQPCTNLLGLLCPAGSR